MVRLMRFCSIFWRDMVSAEAVEEIGFDPDHFEESGERAKTMRAGQPAEPRSWQVLEDECRIRPCRCDV